MFRALLEALRRFFSRLRVRRLIARQLPRGLGEVRLVLPREAPAAEPPPGEFWTPPLAGRNPSRLLRLSALPPPPAHLEVVQPRKFRLDAGFRVPPEVEPPTVPPAPAEPLQIRPRTPLARAPLHRLEPRNFRLDPRTHAPANETIVPAPGDPAYRWISPEFRRRHLDLPWMARERVRFLGPMHAEWFLMWWDQTVKESLGPGEPDAWERPDEVDWALDQCKEQMLIRRDVVKDEQPPAEQEMSAPQMEHPLVAWDPVPLPQLVPQKEWVLAADPRTLAPRPSHERQSREAYLQWRTLMDALEET
ncbi:MAG: hypothetical protein E6J65_03825 [Deltaproteobacteria bacterium]|nr:MAG: hypothetical protein E6J65_03825 [Deltaproteobacteria bacterium]